MIRPAGIAFGLVVLTATLAGAQQPPAPTGQRAGGPGAGPPAASNLQVLPKDIPREQLLQTMQAFTQALGVQCNYCHVQEGRGGRNDMAADEKPTKKTARAMIVLAREINDKLPAVVSKTADNTTRVGCKASLCIVTNSVLFQQATACRSLPATAN